jgi:hypothetical protein
MDKIDGPCKDCLVLASCRNKGWYELMSSCVMLRIDLWQFADKNTRDKGKNVKVVSVGMVFHMSMASDKTSFVIGSMI